MGKPRLAKNGLLRLAVEVLPLPSWSWGWPTFHRTGRETSLGRLRTVVFGAARQHRLRRPAGDPGRGAEPHVPGLSFPERRARRSPGRALVADHRDLARRVSAF